jgi:hypothetical protein
MQIRKIAVVGGLAAGAALAFAPLASADDLSSVVSGEESLLNSIFVGDADAAGVGSDVTAATSTNPFDIITPADIATVQGSGATLGTTPFDYLIYGVDPTAAGLASDPGSYNVFNGALTEFSDATNVELYSLLNNGDLISGASAASDLFGSPSEIATALGTDSVTGAASDFFNAGLGDLAGFFDIGSLSL